MTVPPPEHDCAWRTETLRLREEVGELKAQLQALERHVFGKRSEKMPAVKEELRRRGQLETDTEAALAKRRANAELKQTLAARRLYHVIPDEERVCPKCGGTNLKPVGLGKVTSVYEYIPARFERQEHVQETLACACCDGIITAKKPAGPFDRSIYGAGFVAHLITAKCADSIPQYRTQKEFKRLGIPMARSTMVDLLHRAAEVVRPLVELHLGNIAGAEIVQADETPMRVQARGKTRRAYIWTFLAGELIGYRFSISRSGETATKLLGASTGTLVVDAYTGYNAVIKPEGRERAGCMAHARRNFFEALATAPQAQRAMDFILNLYKVEHEALAAGVSQTEAHLRMRQERSKKILDEFRVWLDAEQPEHLPKSPLGEAIGYTLRNWESLTRFVTDARIPIDNNASERALRTVALGRKNYLFVGNKEAGENLAGLYSLVATCEAKGINPQAYLADVLPRIADYPARKLDELLPQNWKPPNNPVALSTTE